MKKWIQPKVPKMANMYSTNFAQRSENFAKKFAK